MSKVITCPCGKIPHETKAKALKHAQAMAGRRRERLKAYLCDWGYWHVGHEPHERRALRGNRAGSAAPKPRRKAPR